MTGRIITIDMFPKECICVKTYIHLLPLFQQRSTREKQNRQQDHKLVHQTAALIRASL